MAISERAKEITRIMYGSYDSDSGNLFGISPNNRPAVEAIVQVVLELTEKEADNEHRDEAR